MNSITPLSITAHTFAIDHELNERRHDAAIRNQVRDVLHGAGRRLFGLVRPTQRRQRAPRQRPRFSGTACTS